MAFNQLLLVRILSLVSDRNLLKLYTRKSGILLYISQMAGSRLTLVMVDPTVQLLSSDPALSPLKCLLRE